MKEKMIKIYESIGSEVYHVNKSMGTVAKVVIVGFKIQDGNLYPEIQFKSSSPQYAYVNCVFFELEHALNELEWNNA